MNGDERSLVIILRNGHLIVPGGKNDKCCEIVKEWHDLRRKAGEDSVEGHEAQHKISYGMLRHLNSDGEMTWACKIEDIVAMYVAAKSLPTPQDRFAQTAAELAERQLRELQQGDDWKGEGKEDE